MERSKENNFGTRQIATTAVLRESAVSVKEIELFNQLYTEMSRLALLLEFSKNKSNRKAVVATES
ncbi:MAG: hypothetical protein II586_08150, partial [Butyrivibrio sp.]|nr:hypothetical protein [Butyrivibrio sp.]